MKIAIVIDTIIPVFAYGGTERVMWYLGRELHRMGHHIVYVAPKGSKCDFGTVVEIDPSIPIEGQIPADVDVVHFNSYNPNELDRPYIVTWHGNFLKGELDRNSLFVSRQHAQRYSSDQYVYNGMDWEDYGTVDLSCPRTHYHFLGQAAWSQKNLRGAISVIDRLSGETLKVMGGHRFNWKHGIKFYTLRNADFLGMVGGQSKFDVLQHSKGFIFPVRWDEPFGIAITESLYYGCPVFGTPYGSLPELVPSDVGFLTTSAAEMADHIAHHYSYSPKVCHEYARDVHNAKVMAQAYLSKYERVMNGHHLNDSNPKAIKPDTKGLLWMD